jgi:type IV pilus assembly protein PilV
MTRDFHSSCRAASNRANQHGGFLLEALVGILIFTLGVLGLFALQARAIGYSSDAQYRGEAAYLSNAYLSKMWAMPRGSLTALFDDAGEAEYDAFAARIADRLPGASLIPNNPTVVITQPGSAAGIANVAGSGMALTDNSTLVTITIQWMQPSTIEGESVTHRYEISSILGLN